MQVEQIALDKLIPYARNPRHNTAAVAKVAASLKEFGFRQPIVVDAEMVIVAGHTRYLAAQKLALDTVPVHIARNLTALQIKAYRLADNRTHEDSTWDEDLLGIELEELQGLDLDLGLTGFGEEEVARLLGEAGEVDLPDLPDGDREPFQEMTFTLHDTQVELVKRALAAGKGAGDFDTTLSDNSNGNALARVCEAYLDER